MLLNIGTQERFISETTLATGSTVKHGSTRTDSILVSLWVGSVTSGDLSIEIFTLTDEGKEVSIITFPVLTAGTTELLLRKSAVTLQNFKIIATYSGIVEYEVYVRAVVGGGESSARILGNTSWSVSQATVGTSAQVLVASTLTDRQGLLVKNWSSTATVYIAETLLKATTAGGYPLGPRDALALDIAAGAEVYIISDTPGADIRIGQAGG